MSRPLLSPVLYPRWTTACFVTSQKAEQSRAGPAPQTSGLASGLPCVRAGAGGDKFRAACSASHAVSPFCAQKASGLQSRQVKNGESPGVRTGPRGARSLARGGTRLNPLAAQSISHSLRRPTVIWPPSLWVHSSSRGCRRPGGQEATGNNDER